ncbi:MAG: potassium-transporting ATPase subunit KdpC [Hyphomicrobiaceae bacterium]|nr:potassium-transporting ATPase subunit KdpC [Hyphomicrobiaceae bacterium]
MLRLCRPALVLMIAFTLLTGLAYPLAVTGMVQLLFPTGANGSLLRIDGKVVGSALIGQAFAADRYFQPRPSATGAADPQDDTKTVDSPYNASASTGSNLGPLSRKLIDRVAADVERLKTQGNSRIPADAVTASASGLDPHISPAYALLQVERVARARKLPVASVRRLVESVTEPRGLGFIGEPRVNVLLLNMALDRMRSDVAG